MKFTEYAQSPTSYAFTSRAVEPDDDADLPGAPVKAILLVTDGDVSFLPAGNPDDDPVTLTGMRAGFMPPFVVRRVLATGTTATIRTLEN